MNFEDCKEVFLQYLNSEITKQELGQWASEHCDNCKEKACYCDDCPMMMEGNCMFPL